MSWIAFEAGATLGERGRENGTILRDEEHRSAARISLEQDGYAPFSITCGIYGWMVHKRFFPTRHQAEVEYEKMKSALANIVALFPDEDDFEAKTKSDTVMREIERFVFERFA